MGHPGTEPLGARATEILKTGVTGQRNLVNAAPFMERVHEPPFMDRLHGAPIFTSAKSRSNQRS